MKAQGYPFVNLNKFLACQLLRCLAEGAKEYIVKPVKLSDVKRLKEFIMEGEIHNVSYPTSSHPSEPSSRNHIMNPLFLGYPCSSPTCSCMSRRPRFRCNSSKYHESELSFYWQLESVWFFPVHIEICSCEYDEGERGTKGRGEFSGRKLTWKNQPNSMMFLSVFHPCCMKHENFASTDHSESLSNLCRKSGIMSELWAFLWKKAPKCNFFQF